MARPKFPPAQSPRSLRVRSRRLDEIDAAKLATAYALLARRLLEARRARTDNEEHILGLAEIAEAETRRARSELARLDDQERKLFTAHYADRITEHIFAEEHERLRRERAAADALVARYQTDHQTALEMLEIALELTDDIQGAYLKADHTERRLFNQEIGRAHV